MATPESARSRWVRWEVDQWLASRSVEDMIILDAAGTIAFDDDGRPLPTDALPPRLLADLTTEPIMVTLPVANPVDADDSRWQGALASIVARLDDVPKSRLVGEHVTNSRRWRRIRSTATATLILLLAVVAVAALVAVGQRDEARRQERVADARLLLNEAQEGMAGDPRTALRLAEAARQLDPSPENVTGLQRLVTGTRYAGTLAGHAVNVTAAAFSADGATLAAADQDGRTILWDTRDIDHPQRAGPAFAAQNSSLNDLAFSPTAPVLATGDDDGGVALWDVHDPARPVPLGDQLENPTQVRTLAFTPDGTHLLCGLGDGTLAVWDVRSPAAPAQIADPRVATTVESIAVARDRPVIAVGDEDGAVRLLDVTDAAHPSPIGDPLLGTAGSATAVAISPDASLVASGSEDSTTLVWHLPDRRLTRLGAAVPDRTDGISGTTLAPDLRTLTATDRNGVTTVWDLTDDRATVRMAQPDVKGSRSVSTVALRPGGDALATGGLNGDVVLWHVADPAAPRLDAAVGPSGEDGVAVFAPDGRLVEATSKAVLGWDLADPAHPAPLPPALLPADDPPLAYAAGGGGIVGVAKDDVTIARIGEGGATLLATTPRNPSGTIEGFAIRPDGTAMATGGGEGTITLWDLRDPAAPRPAGAPIGRWNGLITGIAFDHDGTTLAAVSRGVEYRGPGIPPPGADSLGSVQLWDVTALDRPVRFGDPLSGHAGTVDAVAISHDGHTLAFGGSARKVYLWDITQRSAPHPIGAPLSGLDDDVRGLAFAPDGGTLAVDTLDARVHLFDVSDLARPVTPIGSPLPGYFKNGSLAFAPDSTRLAVTTDGVVRLWDLGGLAGRRRDAAAVACAASGGGLDDAQWTGLGLGLDREATCPTPSPEPDGVQWFGEAAAVHADVDRDTATRLLSTTFAAGTGVTGDVTGGREWQARVHLVPGHVIRRSTGQPNVDKVTGAVWTGVEVAVRDANRPPDVDAYLAGHRTVPGSSGAGSEDTVVAVDGAPGHAVDAYCTAELRSVSGHTETAVLYHYCGSWTFAAEPDGSVRPSATTGPAGVPDRVVFVPR